MRYRQNGEVIDFRTRRVLSGSGEAPQRSEAGRTQKAHEVAEYLTTAARQRRGITAAGMAQTLGITLEDAERVLRGVESEGLFQSVKSVVKGELVYRSAPAPALSSREMEDSKRRQVRAEAQAARQARFKFNDVVTIRGGRRRYIVANVEPNYGGEQTYYLAALSGGEQGSAPSGVRESELTLAPSQEIRWEGAQAGKRYSKYAMASRMLGKSEPLPFRKNPPKKSSELVYDREMCLSKQAWEAQKVATFKERAQNGSHYCKSIQKPGVVHSVEEGALYAHMVAERLWAEAAHAIWMRPETAKKIIKKAEAASQRGREADLEYHGCMAEIEAARAKRAEKSRGNPWRR